MRPQRAVSQQAIIQVIATHEQAFDLDEIASGTVFWGAEGSLAKFQIEVSGRLQRE